MKRIRKLLRRRSKSSSATGSPPSARASSAPPSTTLPHVPPTPSFTTFTRPVSPRLPPAPLVEDLRSSPDQTGRTNLKEVFKAVRDASDPSPPFKTALSAVISIMDSIDCVGDLNDEFVRIANNFKGFQGIFSQYASEQKIPPAMHSHLDAVISSAIATLRTAVLPNLFSRELKLIEEAIGTITERERARRALEAPGDEDEVVIAFKKFGKAIDRLQRDMGFLAPTYHMKLYGGVAGPGGMSERGAAGNGGDAYGSTFNIENIGNAYFKVDTSSAAVPFISTDALGKLGFVAAAEFDDQSAPGCLAGTRVDLLDALQAWSRDPDSPRIFWLDGMAGTGKSAVTLSFCRLLREDKQLGASFFCLRGNASRGSPKHILPTLAKQLASQDVAYKRALLAALDTGMTSDKKLELQVEKLLVKPLRGTDSRLPLLVLVIDGLDELDDEDTTKDLLQRLVSVVPSLPIKLFITSRPERHIRPQFDNPADSRRVFRLHDIEENIVTADISLYLMTRLAEVRAENSLPSTWPSPAEVEALTLRAGRLFIYASTAVKYISEKPRTRLQTLISIKVDTKGPLTESLDNIYRHILSERLGSDETVLKKRILAAVLTVRKPLSVASLGGLLGVPAWQVREMLNRLHAIIHVPADDKEGVLSTFHASFGDFLTTTGRAPDNMLIDPLAAHAGLFSDCVQVMGSELHFNICDLPTSHLKNVDMPDFEKKLLTNVPKHLSYSCCFWADHLTATSFNLHIADIANQFLNNKFLFWLEVMSLLKIIDHALKALSKISAWSNELSMIQFAQDAKRFISFFQPAITQSTPHLYVSALALAPAQSVIKKRFQSQFPALLSVISGQMDKWPAIITVLKGHTDWVHSVAFSLDGKHIVSGSNDCTVCMWDAESGALVGEPLKGHTDWVNTVAFSPDGRCVISGSNDCTVRMWDAESREPVGEPLRGHTGPITSVVFSPDGKHISSSSDDHTVRIWDAESRAPVGEPLEGHTNWVCSVAFSPNGKCIASGSYDCTVRMWDVENGALVGEPFKGHTNPITSVAFSPDGKHIASGSKDCMVRIWDAESGEPVGEPLNGHTDSITSVAFSPNGKHIVSGSYDCTVCIWDAENRVQVGEPLEGHTDLVCSVAFSPDGKCIVSSSNDWTVCIWDAESGTLVGEPSEGHTKCVSSEGHTNTVHSVAFSPDGRCIVSGSNDHLVRMWNVESGAPLGEPLKGHTDAITSVAFSPNGTHIASASSDHTVRIWDADSGAPVGEPLKGHTSPLTSVAFSPDGKRIASGSHDCTVRMWDAKSGEPLGEPLEGHTGSITSVAFSPDGKYIASGNHDHTVHMWDAESGAPIGEPLKGHTDWVCSVAFSPDGKHIASSSDDHTVRIWDAESGALVGKPLNGHTNWVRSVAFSPDATRIASASTDHTVRIWDAESGAPVGEPLEGHINWVRSVAFSPDGKHIASGSDDYTVRMWDAEGRTPAGVPLPFVSPFWAMKQGWVFSNPSELLFWLPTRHRIGFWMPLNTFVIGRVQTVLSYDTFVYGTNWAECYSPPKNIS